jgi:hypothetical protein
MPNNNEICPTSKIDSNKAEISLLGPVMRVSLLSESTTYAVLFREMVKGKAIPVTDHEGS